MEINFTTSATGIEKYTIKMKTCTCKICLLFVNFIENICTIRPETIWNILENKGRGYAHNKKK